MDTSQLKSYAIKARKDFIAAVSARANLLGLSEAQGEVQALNAELKNDVLMIAGRAWPASIHEPRARLIQRMRREGYAHTIEAVAYTWFNRFAALRYMELHDYLGHGYRVLSNSKDGLPQVLAVALELAESQALPGLALQQVRELKLGNRDEELYRRVLLAQCNALHQAMPFLFEKIGDETELLLPANLLHTDSLIRQLVEQIDESLWQDIEIIGWLYQFYISEKKDQVIGKVVKSEDIPAATQLFTPNWIVKYMVQNSLGAQWLATYPQSPLKAKMDYYIEPAEQTPEVGAALAAITPTTLDPEALTLIDPACGSGHILVEAYELFKAIYLERGYQQRDIPQLILEKNLYGLDIDERAAQLTGFALMMKGRADDRRLFERGVKLNVMALVDSADFDAERLALDARLADYGLKPGDLTSLKRLFEHATTFGSLIQVPQELAERLPALKQLSEAASQDLFVSHAIRRLGPLVRQGELLTAQYDSVVANPPYIGGKFHTPALKKFLREKYKGCEKDVFSAFIRRDLFLCKLHGFSSFMTPQVWMFLSSYERLRAEIIEKETISSLVHPEYNAFWDSAHVAICTCTIRKGHVRGFTGTFIRLADFYGAELQPIKTLEAIRNPDCGWLHRARPDDFEKIPRGPIAYWITARVRDLFVSLPNLEAVSSSSNGVQTGDNDVFVRNWPEIDARLFRRKWMPYNKGGNYRKWSGNIEHVVLWENDGREIKAQKNSCYRGEEHYGKIGLTWSDVTSARLSARHLPEGCIFDAAGPSAFAEEPKIRLAILSLLNTAAVNQWSKILNPTVHFQCGDFRKLVLAPSFVSSEIAFQAEALIAISSRDWDAYERSWNFQSLHLVTASFDSILESSYTAWINENRDTIAEMKRLEEENNRLFIDAYGLQDELTPDVPIEQITLTVNPAYRYGGKLSEEQLWTRFRVDTMQELVSYAIGCMMGRYSLDAPGLIYANAGNIGFDASRYTRFPADADGILPITDEAWFEDDAANRVIEFIRTVWGSEKLNENLRWLAEGLGTKAAESPEDAIRRYLADSFFKDHLQTYKKRPIYWLFSSGKQGAFQALVYLHRYHPGTLARMRAEYVVPLTGKLQARIESVEKDIQTATSTAARNKHSKRREKLRKQHLELLAYDEQLRHYADQRIALDLDDGVKVNYGKFGPLLAEVKAVTGGAGDDD